MTYFKLRVNKISEFVSNYKKCQKEYLEDLNLFYNSLNNVDYCWNDINTDKFKLKINSDKNKMFKYLDSMNLMSNKIDNFSDNLVKIMKFYGIFNDSLIIKFDDLRVSYCNKKFSLMIQYLNRAIDIANNSEFSMNVKMSVIKMRLHTVLKKVELIQKNFNKYVNEILKLVDVYQDNINHLNSSIDLKIDKICSD